jgi:sulfur carrier protein
VTASRITLNGQQRQVARAGTGPSVADVVPLTGHDTGVAVAVNGAVVPRSAWATTALRDGDAVEVVTAVQGG